MAIHVADAQLVVRMTLSPVHKETIPSQRVLRFDCRLAQNRYDSYFYFHAVCIGRECEKTVTSETNQLLFLQAIIVPGSQLKLTQAQVSQVALNLLP